MTVQGLMKSTLAVAACLLLAGAAPARYENVDYGFAVRLPAGLRIEIAPAPAPNHGFDARVAPGTKVWVYAYYPEQTETLAQEAASTSATWRKSGCRETDRRSATLGARPAVELTFTCRPVSGSEGPTIQRVRMAIRTARDRGQVAYHVGWQRPPGSPHRAEVERVYGQLVDGFAFTLPER